MTSPYGIVPTISSSVPIMTPTVYITLKGDVIHPGIINVISEGVKHGRVMIGLMTDSAIANHSHVPYLDYNQRKVVIENLQGVSEVVPQEEWSCVSNLRRYKPDFLVHGDDWKEGYMSIIRADVFEVMKEWGGTVIEIPYTKGVTASAINDARRLIGTTPEVRLKTLRRLLASKDIVRIMEVHSGISALIVENLEIEVEDGLRFYDGMWSSSLTDSVSKGKPDIEAVDLTTRLNGLTNILECTTKPIIFDGDTGGLPEHFQFTVRTLERNGISAVIIEDKMGLKKNSLFGTEVKQLLAPVQEFCDKISMGKRAQVTSDFMIIARLESLIAGYDVEDALERADAYVDAGADGVMIHSKEKSGDDIREFCIRFRDKHKSVPIVLVPTTYNQFTEEELHEWGANIIIYANHMLRASYPAMVDVATDILKDRRSLEASRKCMPIKEILELIPEAK